MRLCSARTELLSQASRPFGLHHVRAQQRRHSLAPLGRRLRQLDGERALEHRVVDQTERGNLSCVDAVQHRRFLRSLIAYPASILQVLRCEAARTTLDLPNLSDEGPLTNEHKIGGATETVVTRSATREGDARISSTKLAIHLAAPFVGQLFGCGGASKPMHWLNTFAAAITHRSAVPPAFMHKANVIPPRELHSASRAGHCVLGFLSSGHQGEGSDGGIGSGQKPGQSGSSPVSQSPVRSVYLVGLFRA